MNIWVKMTRRLIQLKKRPLNQKIKLESLVRFIGNPCYLKLYLNFKFIMFIPVFNFVL